MKKPRLDEREYYNLLDILKDLGLEIKGGIQFKFPKPKPQYTKDFSDSRRVL